MAKLIIIQNCEDCPYGKFDLMSLKGYNICIKSEYNMPILRYGIHKDCPLEDIKIEYSNLINMN
jgi:hypothetical protein